MKQDNLTQKSLSYHSRSPAGKLAIKITKPTNSANDLSLAYSPGVAAPVLCIAEDPLAAYKYTAKSNLVGIISNGSAILGLGNLGALASKPVMEGKAVLFKRFAGIDAFDIEVDENDPQKFIAIVKSLAPTFGGINLEDIKAPECFLIERELQNQCDIPIFHDDQHGTSIVTLAALTNALELQKKKLNQVKIVFAGAGAAALATLDMLTHLGVSLDDVRVLDSRGVIYKGRSNTSELKMNYAAQTKDRSLKDACQDADVFLGFSTGNLLRPEDVQMMSPRPIIFATANPDPEIKPELALATRKDIIIATGRSDYPNQVNNVLAFPYIFHGALKTQARAINMAMKLACVKAISELTHEDPPKEVKKIYKNEKLVIGPAYILPKPMDPRLCDRVGGSVAAAARKSGVARC